MNFSTLKYILIIIALSLTSCGFHQGFEVNQQDKNGIINSASGTTDDGGGGDETVIEFLLIAQQINRLLKMADSDKLDALTATKDFQILIENTMDSVSIFSAQDVSYDISRNFEGDPTHIDSKDKIIYIHIDQWLNLPKIYRVKAKFVLHSYLKLLEIDDPNLELTYEIFQIVIDSPQFIVGKYQVQFEGLSGFLHINEYVTPNIIHASLFDQDYVGTYDSQTGEFNLTHNNGFLRKTLEGNIDLNEDISGAEQSVVDDRESSNFHGSKIKELEFQ